MVAVNLSVEEAAALLLQEKGYRVEKDLPHEPRVTVPVRKGATFKWAVVSCTHFGGKFQQLTHLRDFCQRAADQGVTDFWHVGDLLNGSSHRHDYVYENFKHGATEQIEYAVEHLPKIPGGQWRLISGNHDDWWHATEGIESGKHIAAERDDVEYLGRRAMMVDIGGVSVYVHHGEGGIPYALSYKQQRAIERMNPRPDIYMIANWHSMLYIPGYAGSELLMSGCFQATTPFERRKGLSPTVGGWILDLCIDEYDVWHIKPEAIVYKQMVEKDY